MVKSLVGQSMNIESLKTKLKHGKEFSRSKYKYGKLKDDVSPNYA